MTVTNPGGNFPGGENAPKLIPSQPLVLTWDAPGATSVTINNGGGTIAATSGSVTVNLAVDTSYTLTANGPAQVA